MQSIKSKILQIKLRKNLKEIKINLNEVRTAVADYICSEGCGCCEGKNHSIHKDVLGELLKVPKFKDNSGYNFWIYKTQK